MTPSTLPVPSITRSRPTLGRLCSLGALSLALLGGLACGGDFDPYNRLTTLRVLAIKSEPAVPTAGTTATLSALVYTPPPEGDQAPTVPTYAWSWCPFPGPAKDNYPCQITEAQVAMALAGTGAEFPPFDLGNAPTATFTHKIPPQALKQICTPAPGIPAGANCRRGFPVQIKLIVTWAGSKVESVRELRLPIDADAEPNANPTVSGLMFKVKDTEIALGDETAAESAVTIARDKKTPLKAVVDEAVAERFKADPLDEDVGPDGILRERVFLSWFVESGDTKFPITSFLDGKVPLEKTVVNDWTPAEKKKYARDTSRIILVIRDSRGGVGWRSGAVRLVEEAP